MAYSNDLEAIVARLSQDKGIHPKWRNKAVARMEEAMAFILMGVGSQDSAPSILPPYYDPSRCTCPPDGIDPNCPLDGTS